MHMTDECRELLGFGDWCTDHGSVYDLGAASNWNDFGDIAETPVQPFKLETGTAATRMPVQATCVGTSGLSYAPATPSGRAGPRQLTVSHQLASMQSFSGVQTISSGTASDSALTAHVMAQHMGGSNSNMAQSLWHMNQDIISTSEDGPDWGAAFSLADDEVYGCGPVGLLADELAPVARIAVLEDEEDASGEEPVLSDKQSVGQSTPPRRELRGRKPLPFRYALSAESDSDLDEHHDMEDLDDDDDDSDVPPTPKRQRTGDKHRGGHRGGQKKAAPRGVSSAGITDPSVPTSGDEKKRRKQHNPWTLEETEVLIAGVEKCGGGRWADIKKLGYAVIERRSPVDLKDKWRNLIRVACQPASTLNRNKGDKRREIPDQLLARVRAVVDGGHTGGTSRRHH